jgi:hypothetical protein
MPITVPLTTDELLTTTRAVRRRLDLTRPVPRSLVEGACSALSKRRHRGTAVLGFHGGRGRREESGDRRLLPSGLRRLVHAAGRRLDTGQGDGVGPVPRRPFPPGTDLHDPVRPPARRRGRGRGGAVLSLRWRDAGRVELPARGVPVDELLTVLPGLVASDYQGAQGARTAPSPAR